MINFRIFIGTVVDGIQHSEEDLSKNAIEMYEINVKISFYKKEWDELPDEIKNRVVNVILVEELKEFQRRSNLLVYKYKYAI